MAEKQKNSNVTQFFFNDLVPDYYYLTVIVTYEETFTELCSYFIYKNLFITEVITSYFAYNCKTTLVINWTSWITTKMF